MNVRQVLPPDAIPSVDDPAFVEDYFGEADEDVIVVDGDPPRAYPVRVLHYHEIVNDVVDGRPVAVTWCPLCASAVVYDRRVEDPNAPDGTRTLEFGVSGKLADDDLVMYDRQTESEWKQSLGEAIAGPLEGTELTVLPAPVTTWGRFREENPDGVVLARPGGESEASGPGDEPEPVDYDAQPYRDYFAADGFGLGAHRGTGGREWDREDIDAKAVVLGVEHGGDAAGFPLPVVADRGGAATATVGGREVVVFATPDGIHAFENPGFSFVPAGDGDGAADSDGDARVSDGGGIPDDGGAGVFSADGARWDGATGESDDGRALRRVPARRLFAFAWQDDHGSDSFVGLA